MQVRPLEIPDVILITPRIFHDDRGLFCETHNQRTLEKHGISAVFVQDNHSISLAKGTIRGLHFQLPPHAQGKLVRVVRGSILDVAVDLRKGSPTFGKHVTAHLSAENWAQLWIPEGFAHGFCTLEDATEVAYKVTDYYAPDSDRGVHWADPTLGIPWPVSVDEARLSAKDQVHPNLGDLPPDLLTDAEPQAARA
jgi:dTDP-4-dehydrorhamnose 3,5-epimerase